MNEFISKKIIEVLILQSLQEDDMYVYDIEKNINKQSDSIIDLSPAYLYPVLYSLEEQELVTSRHEIVGKRLRKYYHIEDAGRNELNNQKKRAYETLSEVIELLY